MTCPVISDMISMLPFVGDFTNFLIRPQKGVYLAIISSFSILLSFSIIKLINSSILYSGSVETVVFFIFDHF